MLKSVRHLSVSIIAIASAFSFSAQAQIVASGSLSEVDPWGIGWKGPHTGGLASNMWNATSAETVTELLGSIDAELLTSVQADLLRAIILSGGKAPLGDINEATSQRLRLLRQLGENAHANNMLQRFPNEKWSEDPHQYEADLDLATGDNKRACAAVELAPSDQPYWQTLRATCFALAGNAPAANLAAEMAISTGQEDPWFFEAVGAIAEIKAGAEKTNLPPANYSSGAAIALSLAADLPPAPDAATTISPYYAALLSERSDAPDQVRVQAILHAARAGLIDAETARPALITPKPAPTVLDPTLPADEQPPASSDIMRNPLERAVDSVLDAEIELHDKAVKLIAALVPSYGDAQDYALQAKVLLPELNSIPQTRETAQLSPSFVEAALAAGDLSLAQRWRDAMDNPFDEPPPSLVIAATEPAQPLATSTGELTTQGPVQLTPTTQAPTLDEQLQALNNVDPPPISTPDGQPAIEAVAPPPPPRLTPILHSEWDKARFDALILLATEKSTPRQLEKAVEGLILQNANYPIETAQILSVLSGIGYALPPKARRLIANYQNSVPAMELILQDYQLNTALRVNATGEAMLRALIILRDNQPHGGSLIAYTNSLNALSQNGLKKNAREIAFEALAPWGQPKG